MLLWFRNDLRTHDNPALLYFIKHSHLAIKEAKSSVRTAIFFISRAQWQQHNMAAIKIDLLLRHVELLSKQLSTLGIILKVVECDDFEAQIAYLVAYCQRHHHCSIVVNKELEINERQRDATLIERGIKLVSFESDVIVPKGKVLNNQGEMYKVFTPFKKAWLQYVKNVGFDYIPKHLIPTKALTLSTCSAISSHINPKANLTSTVYIEKDNSSAAWPLINDIELKVLPDFLQEKLSKYNQHRDIPSIKGTSGMSPYLAIGALSPRYILKQLLNHHPDLLSAYDSKDFSWLNELIWREFYRHLLHHFPNLAKGENFNHKYDNLRWLNDQRLFKAWCDGMTGYPIVDAAMRQLNSTGWMHNRLRMIVASFLTKHLLIDWRWGERYFSRHLIDGDMAANNGGWQWAASTGCDAQPYFRIFNPIKQSERFDPKGDFIRKYLPELENVPNNDIHFPHHYLAKHDICTYWPAIVDHKTARARALACYKSV